MAEMDDLPDLDIQVPAYHLGLAAPPLEVKMNPQSQPQAQQSSFPVTIVIKRQRHAIPWSQPDQEFVVNKLDIDPDQMEKFDEFLNKNIPNDPEVKPDALKFVENVLLGRTQDRKSKVYYDTVAHRGKKLCFVISFLFS